MQITRFIEPVNIRVIFNNLCLMLRLFGLMMVAPLVVSLIARDFTFSIIFGSLAVGAFLVGQFCSSNKNIASFTVKEALVITALAYLLFSLLGACVYLPLVPFIDGFFDAMSGFTTTGLSVIDIQKLPASVLFFRAYSQWIGGAGIVVLSLVMLIGPGKNAFQLYTSEYGEENLIGDVKATARLVLKSYLILTFLGYWLFVASGMGFFDALLHVMATVSTGGFAVHSQSIGYYQNRFIEISVFVFMILGAIGFPSYYLLWHKGWKRFLQDSQLHYLAGFIAVATILIVMIQGWSPGNFLSSLFNATTAATTTGFSVLPTDSLPQSMKLIDGFLMLIGGSAGSTAGGIKLFRFIVMVYLVRWLLLRALLPEEAKLPIKYADRVITDRETKQILGFFIIYLFLICLSTFLLVIDGFNIADSFFESASALGTVGLSTGITSSGLVAWAKLLLIFNMWAGRLEILPALITLYPIVWTKKWRSA